MTPAGPRLRRWWVGAVVVVVVAAACSDAGSAEPTTVASASTIGTEPSTSATTATTEAPTAVESLDVQGHRGARGLRPENTLPAFEAALDLGVTTLELDLHFTSDGKVVVWHDPVIDRDKCGVGVGAPADLPDPDDVLVASRDRMIRGLTAAQLSSYSCDRNPDADRFPDQITEPTALAGDDFGVTTLAEVFDFVERYSESNAKTQEQREGAAAVLFNIETKRRPDQPENIDDGFDGIAPGPFELAVLEVVDENGLGDRVVIQSFDHRSLWAIRSIEPDIALAALTFSGVPDFGDLASRGATIWSPRQDDVNAEAVDGARNAGLSVIPWTVNDPADMGRLIDLGVDGLITDRPDILFEVLANR